MSNFILGLIIGLTAGLVIMNNESKAYLEVIDKGIATTKLCYKELEKLRMTHD